MDIIFVPPTLNRINDYLKVFGEIAEEGKYLGVNKAYSREVTERMLKQTIEREIPYLFIIDCTCNRLIGWCDVQPITAKRGFLGIGILKDYRNQGIGRRCIENIIVLAQYYGYEQVELKVRCSNYRALYLYRSLGFIERECIKNGLKIGIVKEDIIRMTMYLRHDY